MNVYDINKFPLTFTSENSAAGLKVYIHGVDDGLISSRTAPNGPVCRLAYKSASSDLYFKNTPQETRNVVVMGKGCGIGEYLGLADRADIGHGKECICNTFYYRENDGDCYLCPKGAMCNQVGVVLEHLESKKNWWREHTNTSEFFKCDTDGGEADHDTSCMGGYAINTTQYFRILLLVFRYQHVDKWRRFHHFLLQVTPNPCETSSYLRAFVC